jgi:hypothetical protein
MVLRIKGAFRKPAENISYENCNRSKSRAKNRGITELSFISTITPGKPLNICSSHYSRSPVCWITIKLDDNKLAGKKETKNIENFKTGNLL